jgi:hypothetical protein
MQSAQGAAPVDTRDNRAVMAPRSVDDLEARADRLIAMLEGEYQGTWPGAFAKLKDGVNVKAWAVKKKHRCQHSAVASSTMRCARTIR